MTVIYSDYGDEDTKVLRTMWEGLDGARVITITDLAQGSTRDDIRAALESEKDTLILTGHGSPDGLLARDSASFLGIGYAFTENDITFVRAENIIGVWCYASSFARKNNFRGFYSSMFISSDLEASLMGIRGVSDDEIKASEILFCRRVNTLLGENVPLGKWKERLRAFHLTNRVEEFNYSGLYYQE